MKLQTQEKTFSPITITIESVEELKFLYHRLNSAPTQAIRDTVAERKDGEEILQRDRDLCFGWLDEVDEALIGLGEEQ